MVTLEQRLVQFFYEPQTWIDPVALVEQLPDCAATLLRTQALHLDAQGVKRLGQDWLATAALQPHDFDAFAMRLMLLEKEQLRVLSYAVLATPCIGTIAQNLNGHFRRHMQHLFTAEQLAAFDALHASHGANLPTTSDLALAWRKPDELCWAGLASIYALLPEAAQRILALRLPTAIYSVEPLVQHITKPLLEDLCKILFPEHPWLLA